MRNIKKIALVLVMLFSVVFITGCNKSDSIVGKWEYDGGGYVYTFNSDGTGSYSYGSASMDFTYEDKGTEVSILYTGNTMASSYQYKIEDNVLIIKDSIGNDVKYKRK